MSKSTLKHRPKTLFFGTLLAILTTCHQTSSANGDTFPPGAEWHVCFTEPSNNPLCETEIAEAIENATRTVDLQAFTFNSQPIEHALIDARTRGIAIRILVDKRTERRRNGSAAFLERQGFTVYTDEQPLDAHSKIILIDAETPNPIVYTGSLNFTTSSALKNTENSLEIINAPAIAALYENEFNRRWNVSRPFQLNNDNTQTYDSDD